LRKGFAGWPQWACEGMADGRRLDDGWSSVRRAFGDGMEHGLASWLEMHRGIEAAGILECRL